MKTCEKRIEWTVCAHKNEHLPTSDGRSRGEIFYNFVITIHARTNAFCNHFVLRTFTTVFRLTTYPGNCCAGEFAELFIMDRQRNKSECAIVIQVNERIRFVLFKTCTLRRLIALAVRGEEIFSNLSRTVRNITQYIIRVNYYYFFFFITRDLYKRENYRRSRPAAVYRGINNFV